MASEGWKVKLNLAYYRRNGCSNKVRLLTHSLKILFALTSIESLSRASREETKSRGNV